MYKAKTIRKMNPCSRQLAKIYNEMERELKRLKKNIEHIHDLEFQLQASQNEINHIRSKYDPIDQDMIRHITDKLPF